MSLLLCVAVRRGEAALPLRKLKTIRIAAFLRADVSSYLVFDVILSEAAFQAEQRLPLSRIVGLEIPHPARRMQSLE
jgi:hypothetical protein